MLLSLMDLQQDSPDALHTGVSQVQQAWIWLGQHRRTHQRVLEVLKRLLALLTPVKLGPFSSQVVQGGSDGGKPLHKQLVIGG